jgi:6-phosphofructo-2-kinase/fructose-2,6-biphosphatase 2
VSVGRRVGWQRVPDEASLRKMDKIGYRYPRGESYFDLIARVDPLVHELESYQEPVLIVSHQVCRLPP